MIPYFSIEPFDIFGMELRPFFILVVTGVVVGVVVYDRILKRGGPIDRRIALHLPEAAVIGGFIGAHLVHVLFYHPELMQDDPFVLLKIWGGFSSFGGFMGGMLAAGGYLLYKKVPHVLPYADRVLYGLTVGWVFGRSGCTIAHDHPGVRSDFFLAVAFPEGARHDLGFYELLLTLCILGVCTYLARRAHRAGIVTATILIMYAPLRFLFDFLRIPESADSLYADARYVGLTPAQYGMIALFAAGLFALWRTRRAPMDIAFFGQSGARERQASKGESA